MTTEALPGPTGVPYHRLDRATGRHRWWRPLVGSLLVLGGYVVLVMALVVASYVVGAMAGLPELPDGGVDLGPLGNTAIELISLAIALPLVLLAVLWPGRRPVGTVSSVAGRLRAGWLGRCLLAAVLPLTLLTVTAFLLPGSSEGSDVWVGWGSFLVSLAVLAALVPLQAAAEEYVFRGWLTQAVGAFVRSPWLAVVPQAVLFAAAHGWGTRWGFAGLLVSGLVSGLLTIRTGGLEAAIALHVLNNLLAFGASAAVVGGLSSDETAADAPLSLALAAVAADLLYAGIVLWLARRHRPQRLWTPATAPARLPGPARTA
ncbi:CPBP family intramembrane glutamic endopeptidase [Streptomyces lomondensis]|uniref:CAAX amino protease n=1 Tax=Streptomyces lomondensis TaxID=68229 RepID=A0ABQ2X1I6_9ACTN|nr:CPBP family intramembrane glutamic endopeptidase [Streptomyces lomondensis]MCF0081670.1 CPBP family intramembrane metalloprotease [Streptomyces lomondensis]GGW91971.1 CAAX amino protease [Streptomyces lomondensis]